MWNVKFVEMFSALICIEKSNVQNCVRMFSQDKEERAVGRILGAGRLKIFEIAN